MIPALLLHIQVAILIVSERDGSNSAYAAKTFIELLKERDISYQEIDLSRAHLEAYRDQRESPTPSYPQDDFEKIIKILAASDCWVAFTPVYWYSIPSKYKAFIERFSEAIRNKEWNIKQKIKGKKWAQVVVSGDDKEDYAEAFWKIHEMTCNFLNVLPIRGPWFKANLTYELQTKQRDVVQQNLELFLDQLNVKPATD